MIIAFIVGLFFGALITTLMVLAGYDRREDE